MFKHYLLSTFRHLWKRRLYSFISLLSLTLGLFIVCLIFLHVRHELSYNRNWVDAELIHRMTHKQGGGTGYAQLPPSQGFSAQFILNLEDYVEEFLSGYVEISPIPVSIEDDEFERAFTLMKVGSDFSEVFELDVVAGSMARVMTGSGMIALEQNQAELLFGVEEPAVGKVLTLMGPVINVPANVPGFEPSRPTEFEVAAVYRLPEPVSSSTEFLAIAPDVDVTRNLMPELNGQPLSTTILVWMKLKSGLDPELVNERLDSYLDDYLIYTRDDVDLQGQRYSDLFDFHLQALNDIYLSTVLREIPGGDATRLLTFSVVALLVLLAGSSNVVSLGLAAAMDRRREVGIRKSVGALQGSIVGQYLGEAVALALLALIPTVILVSLFHPVFANLLSITGLTGVGLAEVLLMTLIALGVGLINGLYPALVLSRVKPVAVLKTQTVQPKLRRVNLRSLLVGMQFCFSVILLVITLGLYMQLWVTRHQPLGLNVDNIGIAQIDSRLLQTGNDLAEVMSNELERVPGIAGVSPVNNPPLLSVGQIRELQLVNDQQGTEGITIRHTAVKPDLFELLEIPLLAGRKFDTARDANTQAQMSLYEAGMSVSSVLNVIINRRALDALQLDSPGDAVGRNYFVFNDNGARRSYTPVQVIGVVEDSLISSITEQPSAEIFSLNPGTVFSTLFRYDDMVEDQIQSLVNEVAFEVTGYPANILFLEDAITSAFEREQRESRLLLLCAGLALFLSCVGLYGLVSVALRTQVKEVGVRKVLGASTAGIVRTFLGRFSLPVVLANLIAWPVAMYFVLLWIERFPYQMEKAWLLPICLLTTAVVMLIAWVTVTALTWKAASTRPVKSLRYE